MSSKRRNEKLPLGLAAQPDFDKSSAESGVPGVGPLHVSTLLYGLNGMVCAFRPSIQDVCSKCWAVWWAEWWGPSDGMEEEIHLGAPAQASGGGAGSLQGCPLPPSL